MTKAMTCSESSQCERQHIEAKLCSIDSPVKEEAMYQQNKKTPTASNEYVLNVAFGSFSFFTATQFVFALTANSQAMMTDCAAMTIDAITYLFNYAAERIKHREITEKEKQLDPEALFRRRKFMTLYLELIPPLVSVSTLMAVTVVALKQAIQVLTDDELVSNQPDVFIMLVFSALNLLLDGVNVSCFARAQDRMVGLPASFYLSEEGTCNERTELSGLLKKANNTGDSTTYDTCISQTDMEHGSLGLSEDDDDQSSSSGHLNLNMCSAWTHVFADTLRSITTLLAAGFSWLFPRLLSPADADSYGAIFISIIILVSLGPLIQGLVATATEIRELSRS